MLYHSLFRHCVGVEIDDLNMSRWFIAGNYENDKADGIQWFLMRF